jgi:hypothetical protein
MHTNVLILPNHSLLAILSGELTSAAASAALPEQQ